MASSNSDGTWILFRLCLLILFFQLVSCVALAEVLIPTQNVAFPIRLPSQDDGSFTHGDENGNYRLPQAVLRRQRREETKRNEDFVSATQSERKMNAIVHLKQAVNALAGLEKVFPESGCKPENIRVLLKAVLEAEKTAEMTKLKEAWTLAKNARTPIQMCYEKLLLMKENHLTHLMKLAEALRSSSIHITLALVYLSREDPDLFANDLIPHDEEADEINEINEINEMNEWMPEFVEEDNTEGHFENKPVVRRGVRPEIFFEGWEEDESK